MMRDFKSLSIDLPYYHRLFTRIFRLALAYADIMGMLNKYRAWRSCLHNGLDALNYIESSEYDMAILDVMMPKMDGITVTAEIHADNP